MLDAIAVHTCRANPRTVSRTVRAVPAPSRTVFRCIWCGGALFAARPEKSLQAGTSLLGENRTLRKPNPASRKSHCACREDLREDYRVERLQPPSVVEADPISERTFDRMPAVRFDDTRDALERYRDDERFEELSSRLLSQDEPRIRP